MNSKLVPDYYNVIKFSMDLQTMKDVRACGIFEAGKFKIFFYGVLTALQEVGLQISGTVQRAH